MKPEELIDQLIIDGKITNEDLAKVRAENTKRHVLDLIHSSLCKLNHNNGECNWYEEEKEEHMWLQPHHARLLKLFNDFLTAEKSTQS